MSVYFSGMVSGLDTEQLIQQLMALERRPITLMEQRRSRLEEQQSAWRDVNTRLSNLEGKLKDLLASGVFDGIIAASSDESVATAKVVPDASPGQYDLAVAQLARGERIAGSVRSGFTATAASDLSITVADTEVITVTFNGGETLQDVADAINAKKGGVVASVVSDRLVLETAQTGSTQTLAISGSAQSDLGLDPADKYDAGTNPDGYMDKTTNPDWAPQDAAFTVNGIPGSSSSNEVQGTVSGLSLTLLATGSTVIQVSQDVDTPVSKIKAFVDQYNSFYTFAQEKLAKEAVLQGDTALVQLVSRVRTSITDRVTGLTGLDQLALAGITTTREGKLTLDEAKLREQLSKDPAAVEKLFAAEQTADGANGVARRAVSLIGQYTQSSGLISSRQSMYTGMIDDINEQIDSLEMRLDLREANLRAQFVRMEQMLATLNAQGNALAGQLAQISALAPGGGGSAG